MLDLDDIHKYGTDDSCTYIFHYKDSSCYSVRVDVENDTISDINILYDKRKWFKMLRKLNIITLQQHKLTFENLQKLLLLYKIMGFNF